MNNLSLGKRLTIVFGLVTVVMVVLAGYAGKVISELNANLSILATGRVPSMLNAGRLGTAVLNGTRHARNMLILDDRQQVLGEIEGARKQAKTCLLYTSDAADE